MEDQTNPLESLRSPRSRDGPELKTETSEQVVQAQGLTKSYSNGHGNDVQELDTQAQTSQLESANDPPGSLESPGSQVDDVLEPLNGDDEVQKLETRAHTAVRTLRLSFLTVTSLQGNQEGVAHKNWRLKLRPSYGHYLYFPLTAR